MTKHRIFFNLFLFELLEHIRNRWLFYYAGMFFCITLSIAYLGSGEGNRLVSSLMNMVLLLVPLFSLIFGTVNFSDSLPFLETILSRPVSRKTLFTAKWLGLASGLSLSYIVGIGLPSLLLSSMTGTEFIIFFQLLLYGILLNFIFVAIGFLISVFIKRRETGIIVGLGVWFYFYILYDILILGISILFGEYPLEVPTLFMILLNPIDLTRVAILLQLDLAVLLGFTAAFFQKYLGSHFGIFLSFSTMILWVIFPFLWGLKSFSKRDL